VSQTTTKLGMVLPGGGSLGTILPDETADVDMLNTALKKLETATGLTICTSTTRPSTPYAGQAIIETDTSLTWYWTGAVWALVSGNLPYSQRHTANNQFTTTQTVIDFETGDYARGTTVTWDSTNKRWNAVLTGRYHAYADISLTNNTVNAQLYLRKNGTDIKVGECVGTATGNTTLRVEHWFPCTAGDNIDVRGAASGSSTMVSGSTKSIGFVEYLGA
jgi:hypothetical protein